MLVDSGRLKEILVGPGFVSADDFVSCEREAGEKDVAIEDIILNRGIIKDEQLGRLLAEEIKIPFADLKQERLDQDAVKIIPESVARFRGIVVFGKDGDVFKAGMTDPTDLDSKHVLEKKLGGNVKIFLITKRDCDMALSQYKGSLKDSFKSLLEESAGRQSEQDKSDDLIIKIVDLLLESAYAGKASDIHIEPHEERLLVRFRLDGIMHDAIDMSRDYYEPIVARIKILSKMRTDEHFVPQDGKFRFSAPEENIDVRVSVMPTVWGEKIVLRMLSEHGRQYNLENLGLSPENLEKIKKAMADPHGMLLVTGPTGSGKTTTVYGILKMLNTREVNITTIEDPIEYYIDGVTQTQVNRKADLTFARGLRAIVRQDPDIIMVGEIRDQETADIAINSALTGHLVLSTLHANDSGTTLPRLLDMGIEPFLVASTVNVAIAQRLVRKICEKCRTSVKLDEEELRIIDLMPSIKKIMADMGHKDPRDVWLYKGKGCEVCNFTGFSGRVGIFEVMEMTDHLRELVISRSSSDALMQVAKDDGMTTMLYDGVKKAFNGITTIIEVARVTKE